MIRFVGWIMAVALGIGFGPHLISATFEMAKSAVYAHQHDQMSYAKFTRKLLNAKSRALPEAKELQKAKSNSDIQE